MNEFATWLLFTGVPVVGWLWAWVTVPRRTRKTIQTASASVWEDHLGAGGIDYRDWQTADHQTRVNMIREARRGR